jgi:hypothetical protein
VSVSHHQEIHRLSTEDRTGGKFFLSNPAGETEAAAG